MIKQHEEFLTKVTNRLGTKVGDIYTNWHDIYSTETSYRWLDENSYPIECVLETKYQNELSIYLVDKFIEWYREQLIEG